MLPHVRMAIEVVDDVAPAALRLRLGLQLRVEVGMPLQVRVDGLTHVLIALGIRVGRWQCDHQRSGGTQQTTGERAVHAAPNRAGNHGHDTEVTRVARTGHSPAGARRRHEICLTRASESAGSGSGVSRAILSPGSRVFAGVLSVCETSAAGPAAAGVVVSGVAAAGMAASSASATSAASVSTTGSGAASFATGGPG